MAIKLHGHPLSPAVKRVLLALAEKGLDHEFVLVDLAAGQQKKEPFISINVNSALSSCVLKILAPFYDIFC